MRDYLQFYIGGRWVDPAEPKTLDVINPATEDVAGRISMGSAADVDLAVTAARQAFAGYSQTSVADRLDLLGACVSEYRKRYGEVAAAITEEMGAPAALSQSAQAAPSQINPLARSGLSPVFDALYCALWERASRISARVPALFDVSSTICA